MVLCHLNFLHFVVPLVLEMCTSVIEESGIVDGIYRLSGITSNMQRLRYYDQALLHSQLESVQRCRKISQGWHLPPCCFLRGDGGGKVSCRTQSILSVNQFFLRSISYPYYKCRELFERLRGELLCGTG